VAALIGAGGALDQLRYVGSDYADLAANGLDAAETQHQVGFTSYSAPRVSAAAVAIVEAYPKLTSAEIRLALLVGSHPRDELKDKVRSGGELDGNLALGVAGCLADQDIKDGGDPPWDMSQPDQKNSLTSHIMGCADALTQAGIVQASDRIRGLLALPGFLGN
jgi:hypothetical protein